MALAAAEVSVPDAWATALAGEAAARGKPWRPREKGLEQLRPVAALQVPLMLLTLGVLGRKGENRQLLWGSLLLLPLSEGWMHAKCCTFPSLTKSLSSIWPVIAGVVKIHFPLSSLVGWSSEWNHTVPSWKGPQRSSGPIWFDDLRGLFQSGWFYDFCKSFQAKHNLDKMS